MSKTKEYERNQKTLKPCAIDHESALLGSKAIQAVDSEVKVGTGKAIAMRPKVRQYLSQLCRAVLYGDAIVLSTISYQGIIEYNCEYISYNLNRIGKKMEICIAKDLDQLTSQGFMIHSTPYSQPAYPYMTPSNNPPHKNIRDIHTDINRTDRYRLTAAPNASLFFQVINQTKVITIKKESPIQEDQLVRTTFINSIAQLMKNSS